MTALIFLGPTLANATARSLIEAEILPPAQQGDIYRAVKARSPRAIGLIDGTFRDAPSVWHREILWALTCGVHVFGAASMGALRATELAPFGMRGVGRIFEAYRDGRWPNLDQPFEDDDEVAVIHAPPAAGGGALSDAMVDLRATLDAAVSAGVLTRDRSTDLAASMKQRHFAERSLAALAATAGGSAGAWVAAHPERIKERDALTMLSVMSAFLATDPAPFRPGFRFTRALVWERFVAAQNRAAANEMARALWDDWLPAGTAR